MRKEFKFLGLQRFQTREGVSNHAHPDSARARCQATTSLTGFINSLRKRKSASTGAETGTEWKRYDVATSSREKKFNCDGERQFYDHSDLSQDHRADELQHHHFVTMIDVDFHVTDWSRYANNPVAAYTRIPDAVAGPTTEGSYRLEEEEGVVKMTESVAGGATWRSGLWDYSTDRVIIRGAWGLSHTLAAVEKVPQPNVPGRFIVFVVPIARIWLPRRFVSGLAWLLGTPVSDNYPELGHARNVWADRGFVMGRFVRSEGGAETDVVSIRYAKQRDGVSYEMPLDTFIGIKEEVLREPKANNLATVEARMRANRQTRETMKNGSAYAWATYFKSADLEIGDAMAVNYVVDVPGESQAEDGKTTAELEAPPLIRPGLAPTVCAKNDVACVKARIQDVRNSVEPPEQVAQFASEFIDLVSRRARSTPIPESEIPLRVRFGELDPIQQDAVIEAQKRPAQRARNENYLRDGRQADKPAKVKSFQKTEVYSEAKAPRNISTVEVSDTINLGRFTYPMKEYLKAEAWFMPGRTPSETADVIHQYCSTRDTVVETDYSKFDGTLSPFLRDFEARCVKACFREEHHTELDELFRRDRDLTGRTAHGHRYDTKSSRLSGSQMTTVGNSLINAFVAYTAYRLTGKRLFQAYQRIGPKFGDDGIDDERGLFGSAAKLLGLSIKTDKRDTSRYVTFCGRVYLQPRYSNQSIFNPVKALRSLPVALAGTKHEEKVNGYLAMDPRTPLISDYALAIKRVFKMGDAIDDYMRDVYVVSDGPFPYDATPATDGFAIEIISELLSTSSDAVRKCIDSLKEAKTESQLQSLYGVFFPNDKTDRLPNARLVPAKSTNKVHCTSQAARNLEQQREAPQPRDPKSRKGRRERKREAAKPDDQSEFHSAEEGPPAAAPQAAGRPAAWHPTGRKLRENTTKSKGNPGVE